MKKILSMILALTMTLSLTVVGFAMSGKGKITGMTSGLSIGYSGNSDLDVVHPQDERVEYIHLYDTMFSWDEVDIPDDTKHDKSMKTSKKRHITCGKTRSV